jgi:hypothetical protein
LEQGISPGAHPGRPLPAQIIDAIAQPLKGESGSTSQDPPDIVNFPVIMRKLVCRQPDFLR